MNLTIRLSLIFIFIILSPHLGAAGYYNTRFGFSDGPPRLVFSTAPQTVMSYLCSGIVTVKHIKGNNTAVNVTSDLTINLSGTGSTTFYSDSSCTTPITSVTIATGTNTASFYTLASAVGAAAISANATGYLVVSQNETFTTNPYVWTGAGGNANWNTAANWSGGVVPGSTNNAIFSITCVTNCSPLINTSISVQGIRLHTGYTGTITQGAGFTITLGSRGWAQLDGTFIGGDSNITHNGPYAISGGSFTPTSAINQFNSHYTVSGTPLLNLASSNYNFRGSSSTRTIKAGTTNYASVTIGSPAGCYDIGITINGTFNVQDLNLACADNYTFSLSGGTINVSGNLSIGAAAAGSTQVNLTGSGTISQPNINHSIGNLTINTGGTYNFTDSIDIKGNYTLTSGTINAGTSTLRLSASSSSTTQEIVPGNANYYNVQIGSNGGCYQRSQNITGTLKAVNLTTFCSDSYSVHLKGGMIEVSGDVTSNAIFYGVGTIKMTGTGTLSGNTTITTLPTFIIDTTGTITLAGTLAFRNNFTHVSGTIIPGTSQIFFNNESSSVTQTITPGNENYSNVTIGSRDNCYNNQQIVSGTMKVQNLTTSCNSSYSTRFVSGTIEVSGNVNTNANVLGNGIIKLVGSGTVTGVAGSGLPSFVIDTTGSYTLIGTFTVNSDLTYVTGTVNAGTSNIRLAGENKTITPGNVNFATVTLGRDDCYNLNLTIAGTMSVKDLILQCGDTMTGNVNSGVVEISDNISVTTNTSLASTTTYKMIGSTNSTISQAAGGKIPRGFTISKTPGATVTLATNLLLTLSSQSLNVTSGNVDMAGNALTITSALTLNGNTLTKNGGVLTVNGTVAGSGSIYGGTVNP